jgi:hypothetical protein
LLAVTENRVAGGRIRHTAAIEAEKELACLVAGIRLEWSVGSANIRRVGRNQSDYGCPRAGLRRESLSFLGGIRKIGC